MASLAPPGSVATQPPPPGVFAAPGRLGLQPSDGGAAPPALGGDLTVGGPGGGGPLASGQQPAWSGGAPVVPGIAPYTPQPPYTPPTVTPPKAPGPFTGTAPAVTPYGAFTGTAPTATPFGSFTAPDPNNFSADPSYQFRLNQGLKGMERSAAAHGTLLTGGTLKAEQDYGQGAASQEYGNAYNRALQSYGANRDTAAQNFGQANTTFGNQLAAYGANRDTAAQNFGQAQTGFGDQLAGYNANAQTSLDYGKMGLDAADLTGRLGLQAYDRNVAAAKDLRAYNQEGLDRQALVANNAADAYNQQLAQQRAEAERQAAAGTQPGGLAAPPGRTGAAGAGGVAVRPPLGGFRGGDLSDYGYRGILGSYR